MEELEAKARDLIKSYAPYAENTDLLLLENLEFAYDDSDIEKEKLAIVALYLFVIGEERP